MRKKSQYVAIVVEDVRRDTSRLAASETDVEAMFWLRAISEKCDTLGETLSTQVIPLAKLLKEEE